MVGKHAVLPKEYDVNLKPLDVQFDSISIRVRIMNLPFGLMNERWGRAIAGFIGKVEKVHVNGQGRSWRKYMPVRVSIDVSKPLMRGVAVYSNRQKTD